MILRAGTVGGCIFYVWSELLFWGAEDLTLVFLG